MKNSRIVCVLGLAIAALVLGGCVAVDPAERSELQRLVHEQVTRSDAAISSGKPPLMVFTLDPSYPNSVGGVDVRLGFVVTGPKTVKYARFFVTLLNRVGDPAVCSVRRSASQVLVFTGPAAQSQWESRHRYECVVYNNTAAFVRADRIEIDYMDGTSDAFDGAGLSDLLTLPAANDFASGIQQRYSTRVERPGYYVMSPRI